MVHYCKRCMLKKGHPGITFYPNEKCELCEGQIKDDFALNYNWIFDNYQQFISSPAEKSEYDYILMLSGGKDSIYMLNKLMKETDKKALAFTYNHPYESHNAQKNIKKVLSKLNVDHIQYTSDEKYRLMMRSIFTAKKNPEEAKYDREKIPCILCSYYMIINACIFAYKFHAKYVLYCADPMQMIASISDVKGMLRLFEEELGRKVCNEIFGEYFHLFLESEIEVPVVIFPYISMISTYNADEIISELQKDGLYETSPIQTGCALYPLLQLYSYTNFDCNFYALEYSSLVRKNIWPRDMAISLNELYREMIYEVANGVINEEKVRQVIKGLYLDSKDSEEYMYQSIIKLKQDLNDLNIQFVDGRMEEING